MKHEPEFDELHPSKTRLKQEATQLQDLGTRLTAYDPKVLAKLPLSDVLLAAIKEFNRLPNSHGARRRQLQYIGKLMRDIDYDAVMQAIEAMEAGHLRKQRKPSVAKLLCERLLEGGDDAINAALAEHPQLERQTIRQLQREFLRAKEPGRDKFRSKLQSYLQQTLDGV